MTSAKWARWGWANGIWVALCGLAGFIGVRAAQEGEMATGWVVLLAGLVAIQGYLSWRLIGEGGSRTMDAGAAAKAAVEREGREQLLGQMVHDLRAPLAALRLLQEELAVPSKEGGALAPQTRLMATSAIVRMADILAELEAERAKLKGAGTDGRSEPARERADPPALAAELEIPAGSLVVILDDDDAIHQLWKRRFETIGGPAPEILCFAGPGDFTDFVTEDPRAAKVALYLIDHDFRGHKITGLGLIQSFAIGARSVLVTSRFEEPEVAHSCARLGIRLLPKPQVTQIPIRVR